MKTINLAGKKFGRLLVIKRVEGYFQPSAQRKAMWLCKCDCGKEKIVRSENLKSGNTQSCGCYNREKIIRGFGETTKNNAYVKYISNARTRKILFQLSKNEFLEIVTQNCFYCGESPSRMEKSMSNNGDFIYNGIDRLNNAEGYIKGNVVASCWRCNQAKYNMSLSEFYEWNEKVYKHKNK